MLNMNMLFGMSAFDQQRPDMCEILERIAPNVSELQLFREDAAEVHMGRKFSSSFFPVASILLSKFGSKCFAFSYFTFSPFIAFPACHRFTLRPWSLGPRRFLECVVCLQIFRVTISDPTEVIVVRSTRISSFRFR